MINARDRGTVRRDFAEHFGGSVNLCASGFNRVSQTAQIQTELAFCVEWVGLATQCRRPYANISTRLGGKRTVLADRRNEACRKLNEAAAGRLLRLDTNYVMADIAMCPARILKRLSAILRILPVVDPAPGKILSQRRTECRQKITQQRPQTRPHLRNRRS
jgi:hypothetical protein